MVVKLARLEALVSLDEFDALLHGQRTGTPPCWTGAFDFPFGLPRIFVEALYPALAEPAVDDLIRRLHAQCLDRQGFQALIDGWGQTWGTGTRPGRLPHRRTDTAVPGLSSTSPLQTRYVPVGKMYFEGLWRLVQADITLPGMRQSHEPGAPSRVAFEGYPGLLSAEILGRQSYKTDTRDGRDDQRLLQRLTLIDALEQGRTRLGLRLKLTPAQRDHVASDAQGDRLDAVLCLMQAAWAHARHAAGDSRWGLPPDVDPVEGWILTA